MPAISSFNAMGWWPHCNIENSVQPFAGGNNINATSINTLTDSMRLWWLLDKIDVSYSITYETFDGSSHFYTAADSLTINVTTAPSTSPSERQCLADSNNNLNVTGDGALGDLIPINTDNLCLVSPVYLSSGEVPGTYFMQLYLTTFNTPLISGPFPGNDLYETIQGESKNGYQFFWQAIPLEGIISYSINSVSINAITFFSVT